MIFGNNSLLKYQHLLTHKSEQSKHDKDAEDRLSIQNNDISWTKQCGTSDEIQYVHSYGDQPLHKC